MRLSTFAAIAAALAVTLAAAPAGAATKKKTVTTTKQTATSHARSRITVRPRSYLDAGTEVYPGSKNYTDYVFPPGYSVYPSSGFGISGFGLDGLPRPFELPSYHAPNRWGY
jgi:hypothetical protein